MISKSIDTKTHQPVPGITAQTLVYGDSTHMIKFFVEKGITMPTHSHEHEQIGYLLEGSIILTLDGVQYRLEAGQAWAIKPYTPHSVTVAEKGVIIEVFSPLRNDYL